MSDEKDVFNRFAAIVAEALQIEPEEVTKDIYLDELGAESLDFVEIGFETDDEFRIILPEKDILTAAESVFGSEVLVKDGLLTDEAKRFIEQRMPELDGSMLEGDVPVMKMRREFGRVRSWVRLIQGLMEHTPDKCTQCGGAWGKPAASRLTCGSCGAVFDIPDGQEISQKWIDDYYKSEYKPT